MPNIPKGYRLHVYLSFLPNELMNPHKIFEGLTKEEVTFRMDLVNIISRGCGLENAYEPSERQRQRAHAKLLPVFEKHAAMFSTEHMDRLRNDVGEMCDVVAEKLTGTAPEGFYMLNIDGATVEEVPEKIVFNDVTDSFSM